jgi:hypothetical protein
VNAFLDGTIEKETYLAKKDELIKTKTDLNKRKADFGRKGNNWIEPLKEALTTLKNWLRQTILTKSNLLCKKLERTATC